MMMHQMHILNPPRHQATPNPTPFGPSCAPPEAGTAPRPCQQCRCTCPVHTVPYSIPVQQPVIGAVLDNAAAPQTNSTRERRPRGDNPLMWGATREFTGQEQRSLQNFYSRHRVIDLAIVLLLVITGAMWSEAILTLLKDHVFRRQQPTALHWVVSASATSALFLGVLTVLHTPVFLFE